MHSTYACDAGTDTKSSTSGVSIGYAFILLSHMSRLLSTFLVADSSRDLFVHFACYGIMMTNDNTINIVMCLTIVIVT